MRANVWIFAIAGLCAFGSWGCGGGSKNPSALGSKNAPVFQSADPAVKTCWDSAMAALKTNGYVTAIMSLQEITQGTNTVTPEQTKAAGETVTAISDAMYAAANKGDAKAREAIDELRKSMMR